VLPKLRSGFPGDEDVGERRCRVGDVAGRRVDVRGVDVRALLSGCAMAVSDDGYG